MSPMVKSPLAMEHALLGFVRARPMHAYEIYQTLAQAEALGLVWKIKQSQLYALLARLEEAGFLASTIETQDTRPPRKVLHLTPTGGAAFTRWLVAPVQHGRDFRLDFLAKLYFARHDPGGARVALLAAQRAACETLIARLRDRLAAIPPDRAFDRVVLLFRLGQLEAILDWLAICEAELFGP
jgi:PadR family transcriptional regulator AphA